MISMIINEEDNSSKDDLIAKQMEAKLFKGKLYSYPILRPSRVKEVGRKETYLFDISRAD